MLEINDALKFIQGKMAELTEEGGSRVIKGKEDDFWSYSRVIDRLLELRKIRERLEAPRPEAGRFAWTFHNMVAHPLSELLFQLGLRRASDFVHDRTVPAGHW